MSTKAQAILEEIRALPATEQREVSRFTLELLASVPLASRRRTISDIAGKFRANPDPEAKDHDRGFAVAKGD